MRDMNDCHYCGSKHTLWIGLTQRAQARIYPQCDVQGCLDCLESWHFLRTGKPRRIQPAAFKVSAFGEQWADAALVPRVGFARVEE